MSRGKKPSDFSADYRDSFPVRPPERDAGPEGEEENPIRETDPGEEEFLPEEEEETGGDLLTKWDDGLSEEESPEEAPYVPQKRKGKRRYGVAVGSLVLLLALVGVCFLAGEVGKKIYSAATDDSQLREYDSFLTTVVAQDPQPFPSPDKADPDFVLNASLWEAMSENGPSYTEYDDAGRTIVPLGDVADACRRLFGPDCKLQPQNPKTETFYEYDSAANNFHVALYSLDSTYVPYTESAKKKGDGVVLRVGYVPPSDQWRSQSSPEASGAPTPTKYMEYVLKTDPGTKREYIYSISGADE